MFSLSKVLWRKGALQPGVQPQLLCSRHMTHCKQMSPQSSQRSGNLRCGGGQLDQLSPPQASKRCGVLEKYAVVQAQLSSASKTAGGAEALHAERVAALQKACLPTKPTWPPAPLTASLSICRYPLLCATVGQDAEKQRQQLGEAEERLQQLSASLSAAEAQAQALSKRVRALEAEAAEGARTAESHAARLAQQLTAKDAEAADLKKQLAAAEGETTRLGEQVMHCPLASQGK